MKYTLLLLIAGTLLACGASSNQADNASGDSAPVVETSQQNETPSPYEAFPVPVYTTFSGLEPLFQKNNDTTYVINFWATWCKPCVKELPYFENLNQTHQNEKVKVVLVSLDFPRDLEKKLLPFLEKRELHSDVVVLLDADYNSWIDKVDPEWGGAIPATLIYGKKGKTFKGESFESYQELEDMLQTVF